MSSKPWPCAPTASANAPGALNPFSCPVPPTAVQPNPSDLPGLFAQTLDRLTAASSVIPPFAIAVSGGPDSTALMLLTAQWCETRNLAPPTVLTIDHTLRPAAADEARQVAAWAARSGLAHHTLTWHRNGNTAVQGNIQARARNARYQLLADHCRAHNITTVLTAHTLNDQAETFLLRLSRGSGLTGLAAMAECAPFPVPVPPDTVLTLARPLLNVSKHQLRTYLECLDHPWIDDPSNTDLRFDRVRMRRALTNLSDAGLTPDRIAQAAANLAAVAEARKQYTDKLCRTAVTLHATGWADLHWPAFVEAGEDIGRETLAGLLKSLGGRQYPPRRANVDNLWRALDGQSPATATAWTLAGCKIARLNNDTLRITRELGRPGSLQPVPLYNTATPTLWDRRFWITATGAHETNPNWTVTALGPDGIAEVARRWDTQAENTGPTPNPGPKAAIEAWQALPRDAKLTLPAIRRGANIVAIPHLAGMHPPDMQITVAPATE